MPDQLLGEGHLLLEPGLRGPADAHVEGVLPQPGLIDPGERGVHPVPVRGEQRVPDADDIVGVDQPAGAGAAFIIIELRAPEERDPVPLPQGKGVPVVFQEDNSLRGGLPRRGGTGVSVPMELRHVRFLSHYQYHEKSRITDAPVILRMIV